MIKAIKTTNIKTEIELPTPFCYRYINESKSFSMIGIVTVRLTNNQITSYLDNLQRGKE